MFRDPTSSSFPVIYPLTQTEAIITTALPDLFRQLAQSHKQKSRVFFNKAYF